ncbi:MAG TPA: TolC family protein [Gemmatimonadales bacterium]|nr:TolC family protein [Gemmatimonadales bacterium]
MRLPLSIVAAWAGLVIGRLGAQQPVTRAAARSAALQRGSRAALNRADTAAAAALTHDARVYPNPSLAATYTKDVPNYHFIADVPLDLPWLRSSRIGAATAAQDAARFGFAFEQAAITFALDTTYTGALAAAAHARLSHRTATDADTLLALARLRREVGDVAELDVQLAEVNAGQLANIAAGDSAAAVDAVLAVQLAMGQQAESVAIVLVDSLEPSVDSVGMPSSDPLPVAAARANLRAGEEALTLADRRLFPAPSLQIGVEGGDPAGPTGSLPTIGLSLPIPLFNWNGGEKAQAEASRDRAQAVLDLVQRESRAELSRARRSVTLTRARVERDRRLLASAERVAAMSLQAYAEGAIALPNVLEAQRNAREAFARYIDDLAAANNAVAALQLAAAAEQP